METPAATSPEMFYWMKKSSGGSESLGGLGNLSKSEIIRGIVTEKLTTAAQEILAVVERTVAGYEEEASGFRREIERQKRQLELLLQPRVKLERRALIPDPEGQEVVVLSDGEEEEEEEEEDTQQAGVQPLGLLWFDEEEEEDGDEEQQLSERPATREDLKDPDYQITSRLISPRGRSYRRRPGRPRSGDLPSHLVLRICVLEDSRTVVLSNTVFRKYPVQEVTCPRGLQEADFLDLLRSTFPQLADQKQFDVFISDRTKVLQPLRVSSLTPEEICRSIRRAGGGRGSSALYIRLKSDEDPQTSSGDLRPPQRPDGSGSASTSADESEASTRFSSPRGASDRRKRGRPRLGEEPTHHLLRVCLLEDGRTDVLSSQALARSSVKELPCPRGLQEEDFLLLLRSSFPQLAADQRPFEVLKADRSRRLRRLEVDGLTPEQISRNRSSGLLYLRVQTGEEEQEVMSQRNKDVTTVMKQSEAGPSSSPDQHVEGNSSSSWQQDMETEEAGGDDDWKPHPELKAARRRGRKRGATVERKVVCGRKTSCKVCGVWYRIQGGLIKHAWSHVDEPQGVCGVCGERFESADDLKSHLRKYKKTHDCSYCRKSFFTAIGLSCHIAQHTGNRPFKCDACGKAFARMSSLSIHRWTHVDDKPYGCDVCGRTFGLKAQLHAHSKAHSSRERYHCTVCGKSLYDLRSLTRHRATHSGERRHGCQECGKRFKLASTLKSHEKTHTARERPYLCHICCKTFMSNCGLTAHMRTHSGERPFPCAVCGKGFISNGERNAHMRTHTGEAPYGCSECGRFFKRKTHLNNHVRSHLGIKLFVCAVCGKACSRQEHLTVHMRTHNGERPYQCPVCDKAFTQSHCLKTHLKSHHGEEPGPLNAPQALSLSAPRPLEASQPLNAPQPLPLNVLQPLPLNAPQPLPLNAPQPLPLNVLQPLPLNAPQPLPLNAPQALEASQPLNASQHLNP